MKYLLSFLCWITRSFPNMPGRWRLLNWLRPKVLDTFSPGCNSTVKLTCGYRINVDKGDWVGRHIYITGEYESPTTQLFQEILGPGDNVLDIGANIGYFSLLALNLVGPSGNVTAFEASPYIASILKKNISLNIAIGNSFKLHEKAVTDSPGVLTFNEAKGDHLGISSLRDLGERTNRSINVPAVRIDDLLETIDTIKLIKLDVEGAELLALNGMVSLLKRDRPYIIFELTDAYLKAVCGSKEEVISLLENLEYQLFTIEDDKLRKLTLVVANQSNVLAVPPGCHPPAQGI